MPRSHLPAELLGTAIRGGVYGVSTSLRTAITHDSQDMLREIPRGIHSSTRHELHWRLHHLLQQQHHNLLAEDSALGVGGAQASLTPTTTTT